MIQAKIFTIEKEKVLTVAKFALFLGIATAAPLLNQQAITGSIVNAVLLICAALLGLQGAILLCFIPSLVSLSTGLLPAVLAPMVPFIMSANIIFVLVFKHLSKRNYWLGAISASVLKFIFLASTSYLAVGLLTKKEIAANVLSMMSWPQLFTALSGSVIAYLFLKLKIFKKQINN
jgi:hypothetical protein